MVWKVAICAVLRLLLLSPCAIKAKFTEELLVQPLSDGTTLVHFHFQSELATNDLIFPKAIRHLIVNLPVQELDLAFVRGRWFADRWGPPQLPVTPPGATLRSRFLPHIQDMQEMQYAWGNLTHTLSGLFCSSLNFLADAAMVSMPVHAFGDHNPEVATQWFYGSLPREAVCTENLTPWLKLLPCQGRQGLTQLMDRPTLYGASFHAMRKAEQPGMPSEQCSQPSLTWHQQPVDWQAQTPPVQVQQSVAGRFGDRGTLVLQMHLHETAKASLLTSNLEHSSQKNLTGQESQSLRFCIFQMVPWYFRLLYHTMHFRVDDQDVKLDDVLLAHHLQPAEGPGTIALLELCLRLPAATATGLLTIDFQKAFLTVFDHPPDAHRGFDVPAALFTFLDSEAEHQDPWMGSSPLLMESPMQMKPFISDLPLAPSPNTTKHQLSSAASSTQRMLHFGAPGSFVSAKQADPVHVVLLHGSRQAATSMASDSESERAHKEQFFEQLEAQWQASHSGEPIDYTLLNQLNSSSFDPESSSSPDKSPFRHITRHQVGPTSSATSSAAQLAASTASLAADPVGSHSNVLPLSAGSEKELSLGSSPQESRLTQPKGSPGLRQPPSPSGNMGLTAFQAKGPSSSRQTSTPGRDKGMSPGKFMDTQKQMDALRAKLQVEAQARQVAHALLASHKKEAAAGERRMREQYDTRFREKQVQLNLAQTRLQSLEGLDPKTKLSGASQVTLSEAEVRTLRRDMQEQESLIQGYQTENEAAVQQIKRLKLEHAHALDHLAEDNVRLQRMLAQVQEQGIQSTEEADKLTAVLKLQSQLDAAREQAAQREAELRDELQQVRRDKKELEAKFVGLDLNKMEAEDCVVKQVQVEKDALLAQVRGQMSDMQRQHDHMAAELQRKLTWYAENQDLVNKNSSVIKEQADVIAALEDRLSKQPGPVSNKSVKNDKKQIKELEADVENLKAALNSRHPDSLPALIAAAKPSSQESALVSDLQTKLKSLQAALVRKDEEMEQELCSLRQQHERLELQFQARKPLQGGGQENRGGRVRELEGQLEEVRSHYHHKLRSLENQLQEANSKAASSSPGKAGRQPLGPVSANSHQHTKKRNAAAKKKLQEDLAEQTALVEQLQSQMAKLQAEASVHKVQQQPTPLSSEARQQQQQTVYPTYLVPDKQLLTQQASQQAAPGAVAQPVELEKLSQAVREAEQRACAAEVAITTVQRAHTEAVEQSARLQAEHQRQLTLVFSQHTAQVAELQRSTQLVEALKWRQHLAALEGQFQASKERGDRLEEEVRAARKLVPWTPAAHEFTELAKKIAELEAAEAQHNAQLQPLIAGNHDSQGWAPFTQPEGCPDQEQSDEIEHFRTELESILAIATKLQQQQQQW
ncbi:hypothetical protein WJX82_007177 [Trebouxia sp. C0006]